MVKDVSEGKGGGKEKGKEKGKRKELVVGIITMPHEANIREGSSHIMKSYVDWLGQCNINFIAIPYNTKDHLRYFTKIHGLVFQGGETEFVMKNREYISCCSEFFKLAIDANNNGEYFPIWGVCFGFEMLLAIVGNITKFSHYYDHTYKPLINIKKDSRLFKSFNKAYIKYLEDVDSTLHNHEFGISPSEFKMNAKLRQFYDICSTCIDEFGKEYVSSIEAKKYPFYGIIWHPERQRTSYLFAQFFYSELSKNRKTLASASGDLSEYIQNNYKSCKQYPELEYMKCYFYK